LASSLINTLIAAATTIIDYRLTIILYRISEGNSFVPDDVKNRIRIGIIIYILPI